MSQCPIPNNTREHLSYHIQTQLLEFSNPLECFVQSLVGILKSLLFTQLFVCGLTTNRGPLSDARQRQY